MHEHQQYAAGLEIQGMLDWCLTKSVLLDDKGKLKIAHTDNGDPVPDNYYFAAAFLDTVGFFDRKKRFWTKEPPSDDERAHARKIHAAMIRNLRRCFNPHLPETRDALGRLGKGPKAGLEPGRRAPLRTAGVPSAIAGAGRRRSSTLLEGTPRSDSLSAPEPGSSGGLAAVTDRPAD
jgi:hypothetical protein